MPPKNYKRKKQSQEAAAASVASRALQTAAFQALLISSEEQAESADDEEENSTQLLVAPSLSPYHELGASLVDHGASDDAFERQQDEEDEAAEEFYVLSDDEGETTDEEDADDEDPIDVETLEKEAKRVALKWAPPGQASGVRGRPTGRTSHFDYKKKDKIAKTVPPGCQTITSFCQDCRVHEDNDTDDEADLAEVDSIPRPHSTSSSSSSSSVLYANMYTPAQAIKHLVQNEAHVTRNVVTEAQAGSRDEFRQALAIQRYLEYLEETPGMGKMEASRRVAEFLYGKKDRNSYKASCVRQWSAHYLRTGKLLEYQQGKHPKTDSIFTRENVKAKFQALLRSIKDEERTPGHVADLLNNHGYLKELHEDAPASISTETVRRWMIVWGWKGSKCAKGYYTDAHNRADVTKYRDEVFLPTFASYERRMRKYFGPGLQDYIDPVLADGEKRVVCITHDESTFYSNETRRIVWMENGKQKLLPKGKGSSLMVSGFICDCHGFMRERIGTTDVKSYEFFEAGIHRQGWFTNSDLVAQLQRCEPLFKALHPGCELVIAFDNSMTHHARKPGGLDASLLNLSDGGAKVQNQRDTVWKDSEGVEHEQKMQTDKGVQKGLKTILMERGLFFDEHGHGLPKICHACEAHEKAYNTERCCARYVLSQQPDFLAQKEWLTEVVTVLGHNIIFYPKYHCELNFIELVWGWLKSYLRRHCHFNFAKLKEQLPRAMHDDMPIAFVRRAFRKCQRFMSGYRIGLEGPLMDFAMKVYTSHRKFPSSAVAALDLPTAEVPTVADDLKRQFEAKGSKVESYKEVRARKKAAKAAEAEAAAGGGVAAIEVIEEGWRVVSAAERAQEAEAVAAALILAQAEVDAVMMSQNRVAAAPAADVAVAGGEVSKKRKRKGGEKKKKTAGEVAGEGAMDVDGDEEQAAAQNLHFEDGAEEMLVVRNLQQKRTVPLAANENPPPPADVGGGARLELDLNVRVMFVHTRAAYAPSGMLVSKNGAPKLCAGVQGIIRKKMGRKWCVQWFTERVEAILYTHEARDIYAIYSSKINFDEERFFTPILD